MDRLAPSTGVNWYNSSSYGDLLGGSQLPPMELGGLEVSRHLVPQVHFTAAPVTPHLSINTGMHYLQEHQNLDLSGDLIVAEQEQFAYPVEDKSANKAATALGKKISCQECGATFACGANLRNHLRIHTGERPFVCEECGASFTQSSNLRSHKRVHTGERPYMCGVCGQTFARSSHLPGHFRTHTGEKPFKCPHCGRSFATNQIMKNHMRTHTGERPFVCDVCEATFAQSSCLATHKKIHTGERNYKCSKCGKAFISRSGLQTHERVHTGEKPYKCEKCERSFKTSSYLSKHKQKYCGNSEHKIKTDHSKLCNSKKSNCKSSSLQKPEKKATNAKPSSSLSKECFSKKPRRSHRHGVVGGGENVNKETLDNELAMFEKCEDDIKVKFEGYDQQNSSNHNSSQENSTSEFGTSQENQDPLDADVQHRGSARYYCSDEPNEVVYDSKHIDDGYPLRDHGFGEASDDFGDQVSVAFHDQFLDGSHCTVERDLSPSTETLLENVVVPLVGEEQDHHGFLSKDEDISWYSKKYL